jgi:hypothetical protein
VVLVVAVMEVITEQKDKQVHLIEAVEVAVAVIHHLPMLAVVTVVLELLLSDMQHRKIYKV